MMKHLRDNTNQMQTPESSSNDYVNKMSGKNKKNRTEFMDSEII